MNKNNLIFSNNFHYLCKQDWMQKNKFKWLSPFHVSSPCLAGDDVKLKVLISRLKSLKRNEARPQSSITRIDFSNVWVSHVTQWRHQRKR